MGTEEEEDGREERAWRTMESPELVPSVEWQEWERGMEGRITPASRNQQRRSDSKNSRSSLSPPLVTQPTSTPTNNKVNQPSSFLLLKSLPLLNPTTLLLLLKSNTSPTTTATAPPTPPLPPPHPPLPTQSSRTPTPPPTSPEPLHPVDLRKHPLLTPTLPSQLPEQQLQREEEFPSDA